MLTILTTIDELHNWFEQNASSETGLITPVNRKHTPIPGIISYPEAVEEALCFGWIDGVHRPINGIYYTRFTPRRKNSNWSRLNIERYKRLLAEGRITPLGEHAFQQYLDCKKQDIP